MPDTYCRYLLVDLERLMESILHNEAMMESNLLPPAKERVKSLLSHQRKHFAGLAKVARMAGATDGMIKEVLTGKTEHMNCPVCNTRLVDTPEFKDEHGDCFLECPKCNGDKRTDFEKQFDGIPETSYGDMVECSVCKVQYPYPGEDGMGDLHYCSNICYQQGGNDA